MTYIPRISLSLYMKLSIMAILIVVARFSFIHSKSKGSSTKASLELIVTDFNKKAINNAKIFIYESLHDYEADSPIQASNWEQRGNHYTFLELPPKAYYFRVVSSSLDNSSDSYKTRETLQAGATVECPVTLK